MCVFSVIFRALPDCPILLLTNRDESTARPSLPPQTFFSPVHWFGPADAQAGGTWLGVNPQGLIAVVTNRKKTAVPPNPRSRGLLCRDALANSTVDTAADFVTNELSQRKYAGFNMILLSAVGGCVVEAADEIAVTQLVPGIHTIANSALAAVDDARKNAVQKSVERMMRETADLPALVERSKEICRKHSSANLPGICLHGENWGTVGSTIVTVCDDIQKSEFHYADGPPCTTSYRDYSVPFRAELDTG